MTSLSETIPLKPRKQRPRMSFALADGRIVRAGREDCWRVALKVKGIIAFTRFFPIEEEYYAGRSYDLAALYFYSEFACLNFPRSDYEHSEGQQTFKRGYRGSKPEAQSGGWKCSKGVGTAHAAGT